MVQIESPVLIEDTATAAEVDAVVRSFARAGLDVEVVPAVARRSADLLPWLVRVAVLVPIGSFFATFGAEAGKDAYSALKAWILDLAAVRSGSGDGSGSIELVDPDATHLIFSNSISEEAIEALRLLDWTAKRGDYLVWDAQRREWWDPTRR